MFCRVGGPELHSESVSSQLHVLLAATLQPMSEPAQRSDVVLFNFIFGPSPYTMPTFPFFLQSAEYSGADIVFVGDTPPPMRPGEARVPLAALEEHAGDGGVDPRAPEQHVGDPADAGPLRLLRARLLAGEAEAVRGSVRGRDHYA